MTGRVEPFTEKGHVGTTHIIDKIWDAHLVHRDEDGSSLIYIDRHLVHEVTSPQAFEGLRQAGRKVTVQAPLPWLITMSPLQTVPKVSLMDQRIQVEALEKNAADFGVPYFGMTDIRQGIVHVARPGTGPSRG